MPVILPRDILYTFFEKGDTPSQAQFEALIRSTLNLSDDNLKLGLKVHSTMINYQLGDTVVKDGFIYEALVATSGAFDSAKWHKITFGTLIFAGLWNAQTNTPTLQSGQGNSGDYYLVSTAGNTNLDGTTNWSARDWAVFNGTAWERVDNTVLTSLTASQVQFDNSASGMIATDVQLALDELHTHQDISDTEIGTLQTSKENTITAGTTSQYFRGDKTFQTLDKTAVGLSNVDDTSDANKPVSSAQAFADATVLASAEAFSADPSNITQDATHRFVSDTEKSTWNGKQNAITLGTTAQYFRGDLSLATLDKTAVGLANVDNTSDVNKPVSTAQAAADAATLASAESFSADPSNIVQDATHRFVSDTDITTLSNAVPNTRTVNGYALSADVLLTKSDVTLGNVDNTADVDKPVSTAQAAADAATLASAETFSADPTNITQDSTHRFVSDADITNWNGKEDAITAGTTSQYFRGDKTFQTLDKTAVGLSNVDNTSDVSKPVSTAQAAADAATLASAQAYTNDPTNITQDATHRFVSDTEKSTWNGKQNAITTGTTAQYFRGDLSLATLDKTAVGLGNVDNTSDVDKPVSTAQAAADAATLSSAQTYSANPSNITQDATHRFATDTEKSTWNGKQNAITTGTTAQYFRGDLSLATLDKTAVGLANVDNTSDVNKPVSTAQAAADAATLSSAQTYTNDPTHITQDATHRFATDTEKATWNGKQNSITTGTTAQYIRGDLSLATLDKTAVGLSNVTNDKQVSAKFYFSSEGDTAVATTTSSGFSTGFSQSFTPAVAGDYTIDWYYEMMNNNISGGFGAQVSVDGTVYSSYSNYTALASAYICTGGMVKVTLTNASHTVLIEINRPAGAAAGTVSFRRPRIGVKLSNI